MNLSSLVLAYVSWGLAALIFLFILFLILREFVLWYFKINKIVELLSEIRDSLVKNTEREMGDRNNLHGF